MTPKYNKFGLELSSRQIKLSENPCSGAWDIYGETSERPPFITMRAVYYVYPSQCINDPSPINSVLYIESRESYAYLINYPPAAVKDTNVLEV